MAKATQEATQQKSWQARIGAAQDTLAVGFVESLSFDFRLAKHDILGSIAHATMLESVGLLSKKDLAAIKNGLDSIRKDIDAGTFKYDIAQEDIHMAVEAELIKRIGEPGRRLHTARSRNDQVALDIRLWCREAIGVLITKIEDAQRAFVEMADKQGRAPMPSFTHLQRAQPIVAGHEMLAYAEMLQRDKDRLLDCLKTLHPPPSRDHSQKSNFLSLIHKNQISYHFLSLNPPPPALPRLFTKIKFPITHPVTYHYHFTKCSSQAQAWC